MIVVALKCEMAVPTFGNIKQPYCTVKLSVQECEWRLIQITGSFCTHSPKGQHQFPMTTLQNLFPFKVAKEILQHLQRKLRTFTT